MTEPLGWDEHLDRRVEERDEPSEDENGVCINCGGEMDYSPMHPWCPDCDFEEEEGDKDDDD